jgi:hypothetical protein
MIRALCGVLAVASPLAGAQIKPAPVEERSPGQAPAQLLQQQRVTAATRELRQAAHEAKLAEQDVLNTQDAYHAAQARANELKAELDKAVKVREAARAREAAARKRHDAALNP